MVQFYSIRQKLISQVPEIKAVSIENIISVVLVLAISATKRKNSYCFLSEQLLLFAFVLQILCK